MSLGFRKSLFGFNCDDVVAYVEKTHKSFTEKEMVLNKNIEELTAENSSIRAQLVDLSKEKADVEAKLKEYTDKYEEIERLSTNIGKLYLVAKSNAQAIMKEATESADIARKEVSKNIAAIDSAHGSLSDVKRKIVDTSAEFAKEIEQLTDSLSEARNIIEKNEASQGKNEADYFELLKVISND